MMNTFLEKIEIHLHRNQYTNEARLREEPVILSRGQSASIRLNLQLAPGETILGSTGIGTSVKVETTYEETPE